MSATASVSSTFASSSFASEIAAFDTQLAAWLSTARGRFAAWIAERDRLAGEASS